MLRVKATHPLDRPRVPLAGGLRAEDRADQASRPWSKTRISALPARAARFSKSLEKVQIEYRTFSVTPGAERSYDGPGAVRRTVMVKQLISDRAGDGSKSAPAGDLFSSRDERERLENAMKRREAKKNLSSLNLDNSSRKAVTGMSLISPRGFKREEAETPEMKRERLIVEKKERHAKEDSRRRARSQFYVGNTDEHVQRRQWRSEQNFKVLLVAAATRSAKQHLDRVNHEDMQSVAQDQAALMEDVKIDSGGLNISGLNMAPSEGGGDLVLSKADVRLLAKDRFERYLKLAEEGQSEEHITAIVHTEGKLNEHDLQVLTAQLRIKKRIEERDARSAEEKHGVKFPLFVISDAAKPPPLWTRMCVPGAYDCEDTSWKDHKLSKIADSAANDLEFEKADKKKMAAADEGKRAKRVAMNMQKAGAPGLSKQDIDRENAKKMGKSLKEWCDSNRLLVAEHH